MKKYIYILILFFVLFKSSKKENFHTYNELYMPLEIRQMKQLKRFHVMKNYKMDWNLIKRLLDNDIYKKTEKNSTLEYLKKNVNELTKNGETILSYACKNRQNDIVNMLLKIGAKPNIKLAYGRIAMHYADSKYIVEMLKDYNSSINVKDTYGHTPLFEACIRNNLDVLVALIQSGGFVNEGNNKGITPLMVASQKNNIYISKVLLKNGADINKLDKEGNNAFHHACINKSFDSIRYLYEKDINVNKQNNLNNLGVHYIHDPYIYKYFIYHEKNPKYYNNRMNYSNLLRKFKKYINLDNENGKFELWKKNSRNEYPYRNVYKKLRNENNLRRSIILLFIVGLILIIFYFMIQKVRERFDYANVDYEKFSKKDLTKILNLNLKKN